MTDKNICPFFSVIIPVYNKEEHIARSINSVLRQSFKDFELIIVCDPSTDSSNLEVMRFTDPRIRVLYREEPGPGGYAARNMGIKEANSSWVAFLDADDEWLPHHLSRMKGLIDKYDDIMIFTAARWLETNGEIELDLFSKNQCVSDRKLTALDYFDFSRLNQRPIGTNSIVVNKSVMLGDNWFPDKRTKRSGDLYLWAVLVAKEKYFLWSSHVSSISYRDVSGVSKNNVPSLGLNHEMVNELSGCLNEVEIAGLKRYANRLIKTAWLESQRSKSIPEAPLFRSFYWVKSDYGFCLFWSIFSILPGRLIDFVRGFKEKRS